MNIIRNIRFLVTIILPLITLSGCFMQSTSNEPDYEDREIKAEKTIETFIKKDLFPSGTDYTSYDFRRLVLMKHPEILKLNNLFKKKRYFEANKSNLGRNYDDSIAAIDQQINAQKDSIRINKWQSQYKMGHLYAVTDKNNQKSILEMEFFLNFKLDSVLHTKSILYAIEPKEMRGVFYHFFSEMGLSDNYVQDEEFFRFYKDHLSELDNPIEKGVFLEHCMEITAIAASKNSVDVDHLSKGMIQSFVKKDTLFNKNTKIGAFGQMYETVDTVDKKPEVLKYDRDAIFTVFNDSTLQSDTLGLRYEFDKYLRIKDIYTLQPPYKQYVD